MLTDIMRQKINFSIILLYFSFFYFFTFQSIFILYFFIFNSFFFLSEIGVYESEKEKII